MDKKEQKIELLGTLQEKISTLSYPYKTEERSILRSILSEEEWGLLSDDEKQSRRKASISLGKKWDSDPLLGQKPSEADYTYQESVVILYDLIREALIKIDAIEGELDIDLLRVKSFFLIEKDFIDEKATIHMNRHLPQELFSNMATILSDKHPFLELDKFYVIYAKMHEKWPNKPNPTLSS